MDAPNSNPIEKMLWQCAPGLLALICVLISLIPFGLVTHWLVFPALTLTAIYFWAINQPSLLPPIVIFMIGLLQDFLSGGPIGLWAFVYLVAFAAVLSQRNILHAQPFPMLWAGFLMMALMVGVILWLVGSFYYSQALNVVPIMLQVVVTALVYPVMNRIFKSVQQNINTAAA